MKKFMGILVSMALFIGSLGMNVFAEDTEKPVGVILDGEKIEFDVNPVIREGRTFVPLRKIFEALDSQVTWDGDTNTVTSKKGENTVSLTIGQNKINVNGEEKELSSPAFIENGRTLVPVRAISEAFGCTVGWNDFLRDVIIFSDEDEVIVCTIGEEKIPVGYFNYWLLLTENQASMQTGIPVSDLERIWFQQSEAGETFADQVKAVTLNNIATIKIIAKKATDEGVKLTDEEKNKYISEVEEIFKGNERADGISKKYAFEARCDYALYEKYTKNMIEKYAVSDREAESELDKKYTKAKHILFKVESPEQDGEKKALAEKTLKRVRSGEDFDKLVEELGEDPGMAQNKGGYLFQRGEMVKEFEDTAFKLKNGEVSGIVKTQFGYHIIKRVPFSKEDKETLKRQSADKKISELYNGLYTATKIEANDNIFANLIPVR